MPTTDKIHSYSSGWNFSYIHEIGEVKPYWVDKTPIEQSKLLRKLSPISIYMEPKERRLPFSVIGYTLHMSGNQSFAFIPHVFCVNAVRAFLKECKVNFNEYIDKNDDYIFGVKPVVFTVNVNTTEEFAYIISVVNFISPLSRELKSILHRLHNYANDLLTADEELYFDDWDLQMKYCGPNPKRAIDPYWGNTTPLISPHSHCDRYEATHIPGSRGIIAYCNRYKSIDMAELKDACLAHIDLFDELAQAIIHGNISLVRHLIITRKFTVDGILSNKRFRSNPLPYFFLSIIYDRLKVAEYLLSLGFDLRLNSYYTLIPKEHYWGRGRYNFDPENTPVAKSAPKCFWFQEDHKDMPYNARYQLHYLAIANSIDMCTLLLRYGAQPYPMIHKLHDDDFYQVEQYAHKVYKFNINPIWLSYNKSGRTLLENNIHKSILALKQGKIDLTTLKYTLLHYGYLPESFCGYDHIPPQLARLFMEHNKQLSYQLRPRVQISKVHLASNNSIITTILTTTKGHPLISMILSTADLYTDDFKDEITQIINLYRKNFSPDPKLYPNWREHFETKISPKRCDQHFIEIVKDGNRVISYFSFQFLEKNSDNTNYILFFGLSAAVLEQYSRLKLATLTLRIPIAIQHLYPYKVVVVMNNFLPKSFSYEAMPLDAIFYPRIYMNEALLKFLTAGTNQVFRSYGAVLAKAKLNNPVNTKNTTIKMREHDEIINGNDSLAVCGVYQMTKHNKEQWTTTHFRHNNYGTYEIEQLAYAFGFFQAQQIDVCNGSKPATVHKDQIFSPSM